MSNKVIVKLIKDIYGLPSLRLNGKLPIVVCPNCKSELYAGTPECESLIFDCSICGTELEAVFL